tara:strand:+ start:4536 stop:4997 length:462 start_codon:yes stop_codon:yes gene_type:complete
VALVVALLFLLVVTILSVTAARNSSFSLQMSSNMQDASNAFQSAEAAAYAVWALADPNSPLPSPFTNSVNDDPFAGVNPNPLANLNNANTLNVKVAPMALGRPCPSKEIGKADTTGVLFCNYYRVDAEQTVALRARERVSLGIVIEENQGNEQ